MCTLNVGGLRITPWHPIKVQGSWVFPQDVVSPKEITCHKVFSFLVHRGVKADAAAAKYASEMIIDSVAVLTLAHGVQNGRIASHSFFGTDNVAHALQACKGFPRGQVTFHASCLERDAESNLVCGFDMSAEVV